jgi:hypothetical protein
MANTFELISSYTATGSVANITFSSIPSTYTDLVLDCSLRSDRAGDSDGTKLTFNGSTSGYTFKILYGSGSSTQNRNYLIFNASVCVSIFLTMLAKVLSRQECAEINSLVYGLTGCHYFSFNQEVSELSTQPPTYME